MSYTSLAFLLSFIVVVLAAWAMPRRLKPAWLLVASYGFYATWSLDYLQLLVIVSAFVYGAGVAVGRVTGEARRKWTLIAAIGVLVGILIVFKYPDILSSMLRSAGAGNVLANLLPPLGISYYLFKSLSYLIDIYWDKIEAERDPIRVALYIGFFPQIVSGPIQRAPAFLEQSRQPDFCRPNADRFEAALGVLILGCFEKLVLADRIGPLVAALDAPLNASAGMALAADYAYALQLFTDFSGLTHIAIGLGLFFGIEGPPNFNRPFAAMNIQDYWRRWHMSLTGWLTDYLFLPLRMSMRRLGTAGLCISLMVNMILIGVWHGSNATYLVFGIIHGFFLIGSSLTLPKRNRFFKKRKLASLVRRMYAPVVTFHMVVFALIFFRSPSVAAALGNIGTILSLHPADASAWNGIAQDVWAPALAAALVGLGLGTGWFGLPRLLPRTPDSLRPAVRWGAYSVGVLATILLAPLIGGQFMYARF